VDSNSDTVNANASSNTTYNANLEVNSDDNISVNSNTDDVNSNINEKETENKESEKDYISDYSKLDFKNNKFDELRENLKINLNKLPIEIIKTFYVYNTVDISDKAKIVQEISQFKDYNELQRIFSLLDNLTIQNIKQLFEIKDPGLKLPQLIDKLLKNKIKVGTRIEINNSEECITTDCAITTTTTAATTTKKRIIEVSDDEAEKKFINKKKEK